jgi:3'(2'), 5'-bisphosphate nucleotidase
MSPGGNGGSAAWVAFCGTTANQEPCSTMRSLDHALLADALLPTVLEAGRILMRHYAAGVVVERKADLSPVTVADREAEAALVDGLSRAAHGIPVIAEESAGSAGVSPPGTEFFLVDPLDGTCEFVSGCGEFTVNIGLVTGQKPVFGLIYAPALAALYVTLGPARAVETRISPDCTGASLASCELADMRTRVPAPEALVALESRSHRTMETEAFLSRYAVTASRRAGSSLKFCLLARGEADLYARLGPTKEWDTAAGQAILSAAGGTVTTIDGAPLAYGKAGVGYLNPHFVAWGRGPLPPRSAP